MRPEFPIPDAVVDTVALELYRLTLAVDADLAPTIGRWDRDTGLQQRYQEAARGVLGALAGKALILSKPEQSRFEWGVWWHSGDPNGIVLDEYRFGTRELAVARADSRIGEYGITSYTIVRCWHLLWARGTAGNLNSLSTDWEPDPGPA